jgi:hypothetical protein
MDEFYDHDESQSTIHSSLELIAHGHDSVDDSLDSSVASLAESVDSGTPSIISKTTFDRSSGIFQGPIVRRRWTRISKSIKSPNESKLEDRLNQRETLLAQLVESLQAAQDESHSLNQVKLRLQEVDELKVKLESQVHMLTMFHATQTLMMIARTALKLTIAIRLT